MLYKQKNILLLSCLIAFCSLAAYSQTKLTGMCIAPDGSLYIAGNNGYVSKIKDETDKFSSRFYYDQVGRLVLSQNSKQYGISPTIYGYTLYDELGRPYEAGQVTASIPVESTQLYRLGHVDYTVFKAWIESSPREQVVRTYYDTKAFTLNASISNFTQNNLRLRVASVAYYDTYTGDGDKNNYAYATHYSYDIHGNVKTLVQDNPSLSDICQEYKRIDYEYDLISGKVNAVYYQKGRIDQYAHKYTYDADNRIIEVQTSKDGVFWDRDAEYKYYKHGPLARVELGEEKVQGIDYVYTLQGLIKGVNNVALQPGKDPGKDGAVATTGNEDHQAVAKDAAGYNLEYFTGDYKSIAGKENGDFLPDVSSLTDPVNDNLYNGNIRSMSTGIMDIKASTPTPIPQRATYRYDQLNRITEMVTRNMPVSNQWNAASTDAYHTSYTYDANGNIKTLTRNNGSITAQQIDNLEYVYEEIGVEDYTRKTNRLRRVIDHATTYDGTANDIEAGQLKNNYEYDALGNLTKDVQEGITNIEWTVNGKVSKVTKTGDQNVSEILFAYDAMGNRISKTVVKPGTPATTVTTYYVRDADDNIMATYEKAGNDYRIAEQYIYGIQRLGYYQADKVIPECTSSEADANGVLAGELIRGKKRYELTNIMGNVIAVISDRKIPEYDGDGNIVAYKPDIISTTDYYPFGMVMNGRNAGADDYRFGFHNMEKDNEIKGDNNSYTTTFRFYDPRLGRWNAPDPRSGELPDESSFCFVDNNPNWKADEDGDVWNIIAGAFIGGGVEYVSQVAVNIADGKGFTKETFYDNIDFFDVGAAAVEGGVTSGASAIRRTTTRVAVRVGTRVASEVAQNIWDAKPNQKIKTNDAKTVIVKTSISLTTGAVGKQFTKGLGKKVNEVIKPPSKKAGVQAAREAAAKKAKAGKGDYLRTADRVKIEEKNIVKKWQVKTNNQAIADSPVNVAQDYVKSRVDKPKEIVKYDIVQWHVR